MQENGEKNSTKENPAPKTAWDELRSDADKWNSFSQSTQMMEPRQESAPLNEKPEFMPEVQKWLDGEMEDLADWAEKHGYSDDLMARVKAELMTKATQKQAELSGEKAHVEEIQEEQDRIAMEFNPYAQIWRTQSRQEDSAKKEQEERAKQEAEEYTRQQEERKRELEEASKREQEERAKREQEERTKREQEERAKREQEDLQRWNNFARHAQMGETQPSEEREKLIAKKEAELREIDKKIADAEKELERARKDYRTKRKLGNLATTLFRFFKKN